MVVEVLSLPPNRTIVSFAIFPIRYRDWIVAKQA